MADYSPPAPHLQQQDLKGKVAIVTGATKGIGRAISLDLCTRGCSLVGTYSSPSSAHFFDTLCDTVENVYAQAGKEKPSMKGVAANILDLGSVDTLISSTISTVSPKVDILIISAAHTVRATLGTTSATNISNSLTANLHWPILLMESLVSRSLINPNARIVLISSDRVRDPKPGSAIFNVTKAGLESLARSWALEVPLSAPGSTVNAVSVGLTDTFALRSLPEQMAAAMKAERVPKVKVVQGGRMGFAEDVADVVGWLVSEKARWISGSVVAANGGAEWIGGSS